MHDIYEPLEPNIKPIVKLLRANGINTFASCDGHKGRPSWIRIYPPDMSLMESTEKKIADVLHKADYGGYYIKQYRPYQMDAVPVNDEAQHFIEIEFWGQSTDCVYEWMD